MTFVQQDTWGGLIAAYLFLGGLGGGVMALGAWADIFLQPNSEQADRRPAVFSALAGMIALAIGSLLLILDLEQPFKAVYALNNFSSWIAWGVLFISLYFVAGVIYVAPYLLRRRIATWWQRAAGLAAIALGLSVAVYTGFLLASSTGVPLWNSPALPLLFVVSGFSTGAALLMLYLGVLSRSSFGQKVLGALERLDLGLIALEIVVLFSFANMSWYGSAGMQHGMDKLLGSAGFIIGVPLVGLAVPLALESWGVRTHAIRFTAVASVFVLFGGVLLRVYILQAGYFAYPWPQ